MPESEPVADVPVDQLPERDTWDDSSIVVGGGGGANAESVQGTAPGAAAVARARTQQGVVETGHNCGVPHKRYLKWIAGLGAPCAPWCAYFLGWAFDTSTHGNRDHRAP